VSAMEARRASRPYMQHLNFSYIIGACKGHTGSRTGCGSQTVNQTTQMIAEVLRLKVPSDRVFWDVHSPTPSELPLEVANYTRLGSQVRGALNAQRSTVGSGSCPPEPERSSALTVWGGAGRCAGVVPTG
jgi:hypothetical protein